MNKAKTFMRFCLVGLLNTAIDIIVFTTLHTAGLAIVAANFISTSLGLGASYVLNSKFTFGRDASRRRIMLFFGGTLFGLWVLQPLLIALFMQIDSVIHATSFLASWFGHRTLLTSAFPKLGAVSVTLVWNYVWYSRVVYVGTQQEQIV